MDATGHALEDTVLQESDIVHSRHEPCCPNDTNSEACCISS
jgi:hypothetical protein